MIACDVVLLPSEEAAGRAIEMNREIAAAGDDSILLDPEKCLPHITLVMGCLKEEDLGQAGEILRDIASNFPALELETVHAKGGPASIRLEKTRDIELLHEIAAIRFSRLFTCNATRDMIFDNGGNDFHDLTLDFIHKFPTRGSFENYTPHITIGYRSTCLEIPQFKFRADTLALCHLGDLCTCRKVLKSAKMIERG